MRKIKWRKDRYNNNAHFLRFDCWLVGVQRAKSEDCWTIYTDNGITGKLKEYKRKHKYLGEAKESATEKMRTMISQREDILYDAQTELEEVSCSIGKRHMEAHPERYQ